MGIIDKDKVEEILLASINELRVLSQRIDVMTVYELYTLIILLAQYLYAYCASYGVLVGKSYEVVPNTLDKSGKFGSWLDYAKKIIYARNILCHNFGVKSKMHSVNSITNNRKQIIRFLKFLGIIEEQKSDPLAELMAASTAAIR